MTTSSTTASGVVEWLSNDPIGISGGLNQYVFCANNPVNFTDAFGLKAGDPYATPTMAAIAALDEYASGFTFLEHGGLVYTTTDSRGSRAYTYSEPVHGGPFSVNPFKAAGKIPAKDAKAEVVGMYHSHPWFADSPFSSTDTDSLAKVHKGYPGFRDSWVIYRDVIMHEGFMQDNSVISPHIVDRSNPCKE